MEIRISTILLCGIGHIHEAMELVETLHDGVGEGTQLDKRVSTLYLGRRAKSLNLVNRALDKVLELRDKSRPESWIFGKGS